MNASIDLRPIPGADSPTLPAELQAELLESAIALGIEIGEENGRLRALNAELAAELQSVIGWIPGRAAFHTDEPIEAVERARAALEKHRKGVTA